MAAGKRAPSRAGLTDYSLASIKGQIGAASPTPPDFRDPVNQAKAEAMELLGREQFLSLRGNWSLSLIVWISGLLLYQVALAVVVGLGWLDFTKYQWFLPLVVAQNFGQIVGMGYIIIRFLYPGVREPQAKAK